MTPIYAKICGDMQRGGRLKAVKTLREQVAPVLKLLFFKIIFRWVTPIRAEIGGEVQSGRRMKAVKTLFEKVAPVPRLLFHYIIAMTT